MRESPRSKGKKEDPDAVFAVCLEISRPNPKLLVEFSKLPTASLSDAAGGLNTMDSGIKVMWPGAHVCGPACTVATRGGDFLATLKGLHAAERGDVLVIDSQGKPDMALWGEIATVEAQRKGLAGLVADGNVRDIDGICKRKFPVFARGTTPRVAGRSSLGEVNVPIQCGGVVVRPGDIVVGDSDGVVVVSKDKAGKILRLALDIVTYEDVLLGKVARGLTQVEIFSLEEQCASLNDAHLKGHIKF